MNFWLLSCVFCTLCGNHESFYQKERKEESGFGQAKTLAIPSRVDHLIANTAISYQTDFDAAPHQGPFHHPLRQNHGVKGTMAMLPVQEAQQSQHRLLRIMWPIMGAMLGQGVCPWGKSLLLTERMASMDCMAPVGCRQFTKAKEPQETSEKPQEGGQRWWEGKAGAIGTTEVAISCARLLQDQGYEPTTCCKTSSNTKAGGIYGRGSRPDCNAPDHISRRITTGASSKGGQNQKDLTYGPEAPHQPADQGEERIGCAKRSEMQTQSVETPCGGPRTEYQSATPAVSECHPGLRHLRGGIDIPIPECQGRYLANHPTKQASRRGPTCPTRCGLRHFGRHIYGPYRGRRRSNGWGDRRGSRRDSTSPGDPAHLECLCGFPDRRTCKIAIQRAIGSQGYREKLRNRRWRNQEGFMRRRSGMKSTQQSVSTERDRPRNLRFSTCVGFCESDYVGSVATQPPHTNHTYGWTVLEEPKMPTSPLSRHGMTTEDARQYALEHTISTAEDFLNPWAAIYSAFELYLEVSQSDPVWALPLSQGDFDDQHPDEQHHPMPTSDTGRPRHRPLPHAFASAMTQHVQDSVIEMHQAGTITVISFGYNGRYIGERSLQVEDQQRSAWRQLLREQWSDFDDGSCFELHGVIPPPVNDRSTVTVIVQLANIPDGKACTLIQFVPMESLPEQPFVELLPMQAMRSTVFQACDRHLESEGTAVIKQGHALWLTGEVRQQWHGVYLRILIDSHEDDAVSMSQVGTPALLTQPMPMTCRPNADITLDFDDFIPQPGGGRIIPPPNWNAHPLLRFANDNEAVYRNRHGFLTVDCRTWLLPHGGQGRQQPRDIQIRAQLMLHLAERIRHLWRDIVAPGDALRIQHVRPTPLARGPQRQSSPKMHILVEVNRPLGSQLRPTLLSFQQISAQGLGNEVLWLPWLAEEVVTLRSIHGASALQCEPQNLLVPLADRARGWMQSHQQRHVAPGAYLPIWWDLRWSADPEPIPRSDASGQQEQGEQEEEESLSLMQRAASRSPRRTTPISASSHEDDNRAPVHTFRMSASYRKVVLDRSQEMAYIPQLTRLWQLPPHNPLIAIHQVWHGPVDLEDGAKATLLLELAADRNRQAIADDQMVLADIALESLGDSTIIRRVLWTRRFMTRPSFLHLLSVQEFCNSPEADCHVERNKITWPKQDTLSREFRSGDYVRLLVRGPPTMTPAQVQVVLSEQEGADAQRYLYTHSPSHSSEPSRSPETSAHVTEGAESEFEIFQDSPVESVTAIPHLEEKGPLQELTNRSLAAKSVWEDKDHQWQVGGKENAHLSQGYPVSYHQPVLKPHVTDRWCASPGTGGRTLGPPGERALPITLTLDDLIPCAPMLGNPNCSSAPQPKALDNSVAPTPEHRTTCTKSRELS